MKKNKLFALSMMILFLFLISSTSFAQPATPPGNYNVLVPLPGIGEGNTSTNLGTYIPAVFRLSMGVAAVLAFVMITFGGITYATSDALSGKEQGREFLTNAVVGLVLVIASYAILNTINPNILKIQLALPPPPKAAEVPVVPGTPGGPGAAGCATNPALCSYRTITLSNGGTVRVLNGYPLNAAEVATDNALRNQLEHGAGGAVFVNSPACVTGLTSGCTNIVGFPGEMIARLKAITTTCGSETKSSCVVVITGGTEGGHQTHGPGRMSVDLSPQQTLNDYFYKINTRFDRVNPADGTRVNLPGGGTATYEVAGSGGTSSGNHWHIQY